MAIAFDASSSLQWTSGSPQTFSHTCTGADRYIFIGVMDDRDGVVNDGDVSYNSVNVPLLVTVSDGGRPTMRVFGVKAPSTGSNTVSVTVDTDPKNQMNAMVASYTGVDQTTPLGASMFTATGGATPATVDATSTTSGSWVVDFMTQEDPSADPTAGASQTARIAQGATGDEMEAGVSDEVSSGGTVTMSWTVTDLTTWVTAAIELMEAAGGGGGGIELFRRRIEGN